MATPVFTTLTEPDVLRDAADRAAAYLRDLPARRVTPTAHALDALRTLAGPVPESPRSPREVVALLDRVGSPATVATAAGRFYGFVNGGAVPASVAATVLAAAWDPHAALRAMAAAAAALGAGAEGR